MACQGTCWWHFNPNKLGDSSGWYFWDGFPETQPSHYVAILRVRLRSLLVYNYMKYRFVMAFWGLLWAVKTNKHGIHAIICRVRSAYRSLEFTARPLIQHDPTSSREIIQSILSSGGVLLPNCELTLEDARKMTTLDCSLTPNHIQQM